MDKRTIEKIASLSRLEVSTSEAEELSLQMGKILHYFEQISKVDTNHVEPMVTPLVGPLEIEPFWRQDLVDSQNTVEEILQNAPDNQGHLFKVPPVV